jgi:ribonucleoside-diphosphate reductase beta chain
METLPRILKPQDTYIIEYPQAVEAALEQFHIIWSPDEPDVEKDLHQIKTDFTDAEYHGVVSTLKLFTLYERRVGEDYWSGFVCKLFKRPDIIRMAQTYAFIETAIHAPFYNRLNEVLGLDNDEFYSSYLDDPILKDRMDWIGRKTIVPDTTNVIKILESLAVFSMIEGAILYSSFAFLKHFQAEGKNKLTNVCAGIDFSLKDENLHSQAGAWLYRTLKNEYILMYPERKIDIQKLEEDIRKTGKVIVEHETAIIGKIFEKGKISGTTDTQLINFVQSRVDMCLNNLDIESIFKPTYNPIAKWFYNNINGSKMHDFFARQGNEYNRKWVKSKFIW